MTTENNSAALLDRVIVTLGFVLLCLVAVTIAKTPGTRAYELSIYSAYPPYFWILVLTSLACGIILLVRNSITRRGKFFPSGYALLIFVNLVVILLPTFRGYFINSGGDEISHLGYISDILQTGHFGSSNIYPFSHILSAQISLVGELSVRTVIVIIPVVFWGLYVLGLLVLARTISKTHGQTYLILAFGSVLLYTYFNYLFFPTQNVLYVLPLVLYLFIRSSPPDSLNYGICLVILLLSLPFLHPLGSLLICAILAIFNVGSLLSRTLLKEKNSAETGSQKGSWTATIVILVTFVIWFSHFSIFQSSTKGAFMSVIYGQGASPMSGIVEEAGQIQYSASDTFLRIVKNNGQDILFSVFALFAMLLLIKRHYSKREILGPVETFLSLYFVILVLFAFSTVVSPFLGTGSSFRMFAWPLVASILLNGLAYHGLLSRLRGWFKIAAAGTILLLILVSATIGLFNTYYSPIIDNGDVQVTLSEWQSMEWFLNNKGEGPTFGFDQLAKRSPDYFYGTDLPKPSTVGSFYDVPAHLGYDKNSSLGDTLPNNAYLVITERETIVKAALRPTVGTYTLKELDRVSSDTGADFIFSSRGTRVALVTRREEGQ